jgi:hypothetical protein
MWLECKVLSLGEELMRIKTDAKGALPDILAKDALQTFELWVKRYATNDFKKVGEVKGGTTSRIVAVKSGKQKIVTKTKPAEEKHVTKVVKGGAPEKSGLDWLAKFPHSTDIGMLEAEFCKDLQAFIGALEQEMSLLGTPNYFVPKLPTEEIRSEGFDRGRLTRFPAENDWDIPSVFKGFSIGFGRNATKAPWTNFGMDVKHLFEYTVTLPVTSAFLDALGLVLVKTVPDQACEGGKGGKGGKCHAFMYRSRLHPKLGYIFLTDQDRSDLKSGLPTNFRSVEIRVIQPQSSKWLPMTEPKLSNVQAQFEPQAQHGAISAKRITPPVGFAYRASVLSVSGTRPRYRPGYMPRVVNSTACTGTCSSLCSAATMSSARVQAAAPFWSSPQRWLSWASR